MNLQALFFAILVAAVYAMPEPPSPFLDEPLEGSRLEPELLSRVRELLISDSFGGAGAGYASPQARSSSSPSSPSYAPTSSSNSNSYGAPPPSNSYGAPGDAGRGDNTRGFPSPPSGNFGGFGSAPGGAPVAPGNDVTLSDPELAPLLSTFQLSPTVQKRTGSGSSGGNFGAGPSAGPFRGSGSAGY